MKTLVIGDIHGCWVEFQDLVEQAGLGSEDRIIALGDIVDRGPLTPVVLDFFRDTPSAQSLMGNHERKHVRSFDGEIPPALSQLITRQQIGESEYQRAVEFMSTLPRLLDLPEAILVHGFFEPGVPLSDQRDTVLIGTLSGEHYLCKHYERPWFELYDGDKPIVVGHRDYHQNRQPLICRHLVYGLDTGCCRGGALTGLVLPEFRLISVPSRRDHWADLLATHHAPHGP